MITLVTFISWLLPLRVVNAEDATSSPVAVPDTTPGVHIVPPTAPSMFDRIMKLIKSYAIITRITSPSCFTAPAAALTTCFYAVSRTELLDQLINIGSSILTSENFISLCFWTGVFLASHILCETCSQLRTYGNASVTPGGPTVSVSNSTVNQLSAPPLAPAAAPAAAAPAPARARVPAATEAASVEAPTDSTVNQLPAPPPTPAAAPAAAAPARARVPAATEAASVEASTITSSPCGSDECISNVPEGLIVNAASNSTVSVIFRSPGSNSSASRNAATGQAPPQTPLPAGHYPPKSASSKASPPPTNVNTSSRVLKASAPKPSTASKTADANKSRAAIDRKSKRRQSKTDEVAVQNKADDDAIDAALAENTGKAQSAPPPSKTVEQRPTTRTTRPTSSRSSSSSSGRTRSSSGKSVNFADPSINDTDSADSGSTPRPPLFTGMRSSERNASEARTICRGEPKIYNAVLNLFGPKEHRVFNPNGDRNSCALQAVLTVLGASTSRSNVNLLANIVVQCCDAILSDLSKSVDPINLRMTRPAAHIIASQPEIVKLRNDILSGLKSNNFKLLQIDTIFASLFCYLPNWGLQLHIAHIASGSPALYSSSSYPSPRIKRFISAQIVNLGNHFMVVDHSSIRMLHRLRYQVASLPSLLKMRVPEIATPPAASVPPELVDLSKEPDDVVPPQRNNSGDSATTSTATPVAPHSTSTTSLETSGVAPTTASPARAPSPAPLQKGAGSPDSGSSGGSTFDPLSLSPTGSSSTSSESPSSLVSSASGDSPSVLMQDANQPTSRSGAIARRPTFADVARQPATPQRIAPLSSNRTRSASAAPLGSGLNLAANPADNSVRRFTRFSANRQD